MPDSFRILRLEVLPRHGLVLLSVGSVLQHVSGEPVQDSAEVGGVGHVLNLHGYLGLADDHLLHRQLLPVELDPRNDDVEHVHHFREDFVPAFEDDVVVLHGGGQVRWDPIEVALDEVICIVRRVLMGGMERRY